MGVVIGIYNRRVTYEVIGPNRPPLHVGAPSIPLEDGTLQFARDTDGRGDGLAGLSIRVADREAAFAAARARQLPVDGDSLAIAGTRIRIV